MRCLQCGTEFVDKSRTKTKTFCSKRCQAKQYDEARGKGVFNKKNCLFCGSEFGTVYKRKIYCHIKCGTAAFHEKQNYLNPAKVVAKDFIYQDKISKGCSQCPERRPSCLQYHHKDPSLKTKGIGTLMNSGAKLDVLIKEIRKCIILCANCHFVEENGDGYKNGDSPNV